MQNTKTSTGTTTLTFLFMLFSVPSRAPNGVRVTSFEFTSDLLVEWNPLPQQYASSNLLGYIIYYRENHDDSSYKSAYALGQSSSYFTLKDLKPAHQYQVAVTAFTSKGEGPWSDFNYVTTGMFLAELRRHKEPPSGAPYQYRKQKETHKLISSPQRSNKCACLSHARVIERAWEWVAPFL